MSIREVPVLIVEADSDVQLHKMPGTTSAEHHANDFRQVGWRVVIAVLHVNMDLESV